MKAPVLNKCVNYFVPDCSLKMMLDNEIVVLDASQ